MKAVDVTNRKSAKITMLGGFTLTSDGNQISDKANRTHKLWNVLAYLIYHRDRMVPQAEFIDQFWPDETGVTPANALKTQFYRIRAMLEPVFGPDFQPILSQRGGYEWNPAIETEVDLDQFAELFLKVSQPDASKSKRKTLLRDILQLYRGDFLPKLSSNRWTVPITAKYHDMYLESVIRYSTILEEEGLYEEMVAVAQRAVTIDALDERLHTLIVRGLLNQGKHTAALTHYDYATDLLYRSLGVQQWKDLRELYDKIMETEQAFETDLTVIQHDLQETARIEGAFLCAYGMFREIYRLEARRHARSHDNIQVALITVSSPDGSIPQQKVLNRTMDQLLEVIMQTLRSGDVLSRYSGAQYVIMLPGATQEDSKMIINRLLSRFRRRHRRNRLKIAYRLQEIEALD